MASTVAVVPVVLPLQRLKVIQVIGAALAWRRPVPDLPAQFAIGVPVALSPNQRAVRINPQRRVVAADRGPVPHRLDGCLIEGLA